MASIKISLGGLFKRQPTVPGTWTPQSGPGPVQPAYGRPQQARLPQNRQNQIMPGSGNVGSTFGTTIPNTQLTRYYRNIGATLQSMIVKSMSRPKLWFEFTISASDQDYLVYRIGSQIDALGNGKIILYEILVQNGKRTQEKYMTFIKVIGFIPQTSDVNVLNNAIVRRFGILLVNLQSRFNFSTVMGDASGKMPGSVGGSVAPNLNNAKAPKTSAAISDRTIKVNMITSINKLIDDFTDVNQFLLNATDTNYLRYTLTKTLDMNKSGLIYIKEDFVVNGALKYKNALINPPIKVVKGQFSQNDFNRIFSFISNKYQSLINITRYNSAV